MKAEDGLALAKLCGSITGWLIAYLLFVLLSTRILIMIPFYILHNA